MTVCRNVITAGSASLPAVILVRVLFVLSGLLLSLPAIAHFQLNTNIRIIHIEPLSDALRLSIRFPAALAFSEFSSEQGKLSIPYLKAKTIKNRVEHFLDQAKIENEQSEFKQFLIDGYGLRVDGEILQGEDIKVKIYEASRQTRFTNPVEVDKSFSTQSLFLSEGELNIADAVIDIQGNYLTENSQGEVSLNSELNSKLPADTFVANLIIYHGDAGQQVMRVTGLLSDPVIINPGAFTAIKSFVLQGFTHILSGFDHILFILCLTVAASGLKRLFLAVTGFTLGHTITLIAGFYGYVPAVGWFVPLVEALIAASIIFVALITLRGKGDSLNLIITGLIGLLHGFGFSFLLAELLGSDSPHLVASLLAFNVGIELGQILIVTLMFMTLATVSRVYPSNRGWVDHALLSASMLVALWWLVERSAPLLSTV